MDDCIKRNDWSAGFVADLDTLIEATEASHRLTELKRQSDAWKLNVDRTE